MSEQWTEIAGYPGYSISDQGRVWSDKTKRILKVGTMQKGYLHVTLCRNNRAKTFRLNRLVLSSFDGEAPFAGAEAAHRDGNKANNRLSNLYWATGKENVADRLRHGGYRSGCDHVMAKLRPSDLEAARDLKAAGQKWTDIAPRFGVTPDTISKRVRREFEVTL